MAVPAPISDSHSIRVDRKLALAVDVPSAVEPGAKFKVAGAVKVLRGPRKVVLRERSGGSWRKVAAKRSTKAGRYTFKVKAGAAERTRTFRVTAPRAGKLAKVEERFAVQVRVPTPRVPDDLQTPAPSEETEPNPLGSILDWVWGYAGGLRWNPCATITWTYRAAGEPYAGAFEDARRAIERVAERTGLQFFHTASSGADLSIGWGAARTHPELVGSVVGFARWYALGVRDKDVRYRITSAEIVLDKEGRLRPGHHTSGDPSWGQVMTHEVIHAMGLSHALGLQQIMYPSVHSLNHRLGAGDIAGLAAVGAAHGCL